MQANPSARPKDHPEDPSTAEEAVLRLMMALGRRFRQRQVGDLVDPAQAGLLYTLKCHGAMRLGDVADAMKLDASTVSRHVHQLGEKGFLQRDSDPEDARARIIDISPEGRAALKTTFDQRRAFVADAVADWSERDRDQVRTLLTRLTAALGDNS
jgi:DNA-binding MarR family transcriptional regulator